MFAGYIARTAAVFFSALGSLLVRALDVVPSSLLTAAMAVLSAAVVALVVWPLGVFATDRLLMPRETRYAALAFPVLVAAITVPGVVDGSFGLMPQSAAALVGVGVGWVLVARRAPRGPDLPSEG